MEQNYQIAGIGIKVRQDLENLPEMFRGFERDADGETEIFVDIFQNEKHFQQWYGVDCFCHDLTQCHLLISRKYPRIRLTADREWKALTIEGALAGMDGVMEVFLAGFYSYLSGKGGILVHASCIRWEQEGIIFTAASGTGKTTQAELWKKYKNAEILNGDKVILECGNESCYAWGSPWKGSSPYAVNKKVPLKAVVVLAQGKENTILKLSGQEIVAKFFPHVFFPSWEEGCVGNVMNALDSLIRRTPVYYLSCRPDEDAVKLACDTIWGKAEK